MVLQEDYEKFLQSYAFPLKKGLRINTLLCTPQRFFELFTTPLVQSPFSPVGFYLPEGFSGAGHHPLHHAGAFYMQEPSAMSAVQVLDPKPGERVLDLCAAPGGKSTQIAARMDGEGLLFSNEYVFARAKILLSNLERCGVKNAVILSMRPDALCETLPEFFDKVLVDAPCSGEGMFRKEPASLGEWSVDNILNCAKRQRMILESAAKALRPGGMLAYSTCTFAPEENEGVILGFLQDHPEFSLLDCGVSFGSPCREEPLAAFGIDSHGQDVSLMRRIFPFHGGEGHFIAKLRKRGDAPREHAPLHFRPAGKHAPELPVAQAFLREQFHDLPLPRVEIRGDAVNLLPEGLPPLDGLRVLRCGVDAGTIRKNRMEPAHHLYKTIDPKTAAQTVDFPLDDPRLELFLKGQMVECDSALKGYAAVTVQGIPLGFGKASGGALKNHYPKGLREF